MFAFTLILHLTFVHIIDDTGLIMLKYDSFDEKIYIEMLCIEICSFKYGSG